MSNEENIVEVVGQDTVSAMTEKLTGMVSALDLDVSLGAAEIDGHTIYFNINGEDAHFLLNHKAEPIKSMAYLVQTWLDHENEDSGIIVKVDAEGHLKRKEEELDRLVDDACGDLKEVGQETKLEPLNPYDRRVIHIKLRENEQFDTESVGQGHFKSILIRRVS